MRKFTLIRKCIIIYRKLSLILGIIIPILCFYLIPGANILTDPLSRFGIEENTKVIWILFNTFMAYALYSIGKEANEQIENPLKKKFLDYILTTSTIAFVLSAFITMDIQIIHITLAGIFFVTYIAYIFWFGAFCKWKRVTLYSIILTAVAILSIIPTFALSISYGSFELMFISILVIWNYILINAHKFFFN